MSSFDVSYGFEWGKVQTAFQLLYILYAIVFADNFAIDKLAHKPGDSGTPFMQFCNWIRAKLPFPGDQLLEIS